MALPKELRDLQDDTTVLGDLDDLRRYIESGQAFKDWNERIALSLKEMEALWGDPQWL